MNLRRKKHLLLSAFRSRIRDRLLGPKAVGVLYDTRNGLIICPPYDDAFSQHLSSRRGDHGYDSAGIEALLQLIDEDSRVLVVGAHLGLLAIPLAKKAAACVAIEANPETFRLLELNRALNGLSNVQTFNVAAGERAGDVDFVMSRANSGGAKRAPKHKDWIYYSDAPTTTSVKMVALDALLPDEVFELIVMDIEGSEYFALQGMQRLLASCKHLQIEYLPHHIDRVAGVTDSDLLAVLSPHFTHAHVCGEQTTVGRAGFLDLVASVRARGGADLMFSK
jgi:FkbM family methyltransferase